MASKKAPTKKTPSKRGAVRKQTANKRENGQFAKGNTLGNRWPKGVSGNPAGRPRDTITPHLRDLVRMQHPDTDEVTYGELVARALLGRAVDGDVQAIREVFDRLEGKPRQAVDVSIEERRQAIYEAGLDMLKRTGLSDEEAARLLTTIYPEASEWVN